MSDAGALRERLTAIIAADPARMALSTVSRRSGWTIYSPRGCLRRGDSPAASEPCSMTAFARSGGCSDTRDSFCALLCNARSPGWILVSRPVTYPQFRKRDVDDSSSAILATHRTRESLQASDEAKGLKGRTGNRTARKTGSGVRAKGRTGVLPAMSADGSDPELGIERPERRPA